MNQRLRVLDELGKEFERVLAGGQRTPRRAGAAAIAASAAVVVAVVLGAALLLRPAHHPPAATASKQALLSQFGVLRRPQTAADRAEAAAPPNLNRGMSVGGGQGASGGKSRHYTVRITGLAQYLDVPDLTRVVRVGGVSVTLFVERLIPSHTLPKAVVSGNDPKDAAQSTTPQSLRSDQQLRNLDAGYSLWARVGRSGEPRRIAPAALGRGGRNPLNPLWVVNTSSLPAPGDRIAAIVPDGVARVSWIWPREFVSYLLRFVPTTTVSADAHDNVAVTRAPAQFTSLEQLQPETVVRYAPDGRVLGRFSDPGNGAGSAATSTYDGSVPRPETLQSRAAERDPATANKVVIVPAVTTLRAITLGPPPAFFFKVLLNGRRYFARVTGGPRSGCVRAAPDEGTQRPLGEAAVRGDTYQGNVPFGTVRCRGTYRLSVSVVGPGNRPYAPFGSATFTVR